MDGNLNNQNTGVDTTTDTSTTGRLIRKKKLTRCFNQKQIDVLLRH